jgi:hypothetical protein
MPTNAYKHNCKIFCIYRTNNECGRKIKFKKDVGTESRLR